MSGKNQSFTVQALDDLFQQSEEYRNSARYKNLMEFCAHFRMLGAYNALLVITQRPGVRYALTKAQWKKYNMRPSANACPLVILMPFYPVDFVYDISDVEHIPGTPEIKYQEELDELAKPFRVAGNVIARELSTLKDNLKLLGIKYDSNLIAGSEIAGFIEREDGVEPDTIKMRGRSISVNLPHHFKLCVNSKQNEAEEFASLCHELGHYFCDHLVPPSPHWWKHRNVPENQGEFEAESVAWLVCQRHGIDCKNSAAFLSGYLDKFNKVPQVAQGTIVSAADQIEKLFKKMSISESPLYQYNNYFYQQVISKR